MRTIKVWSRIWGRKVEFCIICDECYNIAKRDSGWAVTKNGEFIDDYYYCTKWAAAERIPNCEITGA